MCDSAGYGPDMEQQSYITNKEKKLGEEYINFSITFLYDIYTYMLIYIYTPLFVYNVTVYCSELLLIYAIFVKIYSKQQK